MESEKVLTSHNISFTTSYTRDEVTGTSHNVTIQTSMTVCIAALAENGKKAFLIADKLVTSNGVLPYQTEMAADKIIKINDNVYVLYCGGIADATNIIQGLVGKVGFVDKIAQDLNEAHLTYLSDILVRQHLVGRGIKNQEDFYKNYYPILDATTRTNIDTAFSEHYLNSAPNFIVCGKKSDGLYYVYYLGVNPRLPISLNISGYSTIGSGGQYANFSMLHDEYNPSLEISKVEEIVRNAKQESEKDRDVGKSHTPLTLQ